jgi:hypothetical protein
MSIYWDFVSVILSMMPHEEKTNHSEFVQVIPYDDEEILLKAQEDDEEILLKAQEDDEEILLEPKAWYRPQVILV